MSTMPEVIVCDELHGSYAWKYEDSSNAMVLGLTKAYIVENEPFWAWYHELFKSVLETPNETLVIVGYGFKDEHINDVIADSIKKNTGLKLHVISPKEPREFKQLLDPIHSMGQESVPRGPELWKGLHGYHCATIKEFFEHNSDNLTSKGEAFFRQVNLFT